MGWGERNPVLKEEISHSSLTATTLLWMIVWGAELDNEILYRDLKSVFAPHVHFLSQTSHLLSNTFDKNGRGWLRLLYVKHNFLLVTSIKSSHEMNMSQYLETIRN